MEKAYAHLVSLAEKEVCMVFDKVDCQGVPEKAFLGHGEAASFRWRPACPASGGIVGRSTKYSRSLLWFARLLREMTGMLESCDGGQPSPRLLKQWAGRTEALRQHHQPHSMHILELHCERWRWRIEAAAHLECDSRFATAALRAWAEEAFNEAQEIGISLARVARQKWLAFVDEQLRTGAGILHSLTKRGALEADELVTDSAGASTSPQAIVDADLKTWRKIWEKFQATASAPWRGAKAEDFAWAAPLPSISPCCLIEVALTFKKRTGLGADTFHPRWFAWLSVPVLRGFVALLHALEKIGMWPEQVRSILIAQIPKAGGGRRPVGLLASLVRLWERVRKPVVAGWRCTIERSYNWAAKGRSTEAAVWKQSIQAEAARASGLEPAACLIDLVKAFEMVKLELVWRFGLDLHFPPVLLKLILEACAFARHLVFQGAVAEAVWSLSAILAGGSFTTDLLLIIMVRPCDQIASRIGDGDLWLFVDDLTLHVWGSLSDVARRLDDVVSLAIVQLEEDLELQVSRSMPHAKTVVVASSKHLATAMQPLTSALGIKTCTEAKLLGIDFSSGRKQGRSAQKKRIAAVTARKARISRLVGRLQGGSRVLEPPRPCDMAQVSQGQAMASSGRFVALSAECKAKCAAGLPLPDCS